MNEMCDKCGKNMILVSLPGQMDTLRCLRCTPTTVLLPPAGFRIQIRREARVVEYYDEMPMAGKNNGDTYFVTSMKAICQWDAEEQDWQILSLDKFRWPKPEDEFNDRRGAIMAQRAKRKRA